MRAPTYSLHTPGLYLLLALFALAPPAYAQGSAPEPDGLWRVSGIDRFGRPYADLIEFLDRGGVRIHERDPHTGFNGQRQRLREVGDVHVFGRRVVTRQTIPPRSAGLLTGFGVQPVRPAPPRRIGTYTVAGPHTLIGVSIVPQTMHVGRERLERVRARAPNNVVRLLVDGHEFFPRLRRVIDGAQRSICLQTFIFTEDPTGTDVALRLMNRARAGVEVRVLVDALDSSMGSVMRQRMRAAGVELILQHPWLKTILGSVRHLLGTVWRGIRSLFGRPAPPPEKRGVFNHDHRKIVVVDGRVGFIGGMNIAAEYEHDWHDVHAQVEGHAVSELQDLFYDRWRAAGGVVHAVPAPDPTVSAVGYWPGNMDVDVLETLPGLKTEILDRYVAELDRAQHRIYVESAYILEDQILHRMQRKARMGVDTVLILSNDEKHDMPVVRDAFRWVQNDMVRSGVRIYKHRTQMVHSKVACFDGRVATVGSANLDRLALQDLAEANIFVNDRGFTREMERRVFERDMRASERVGVKRLGWWERVKSGVLHLIRGFL